jgi:hypothetical protein
MTTYFGRCSFRNVAVAYHLSLIGIKLRGVPKGSFVDMWKSLTQDKLWTFYDRLWTHTRTKLRDVFSEFGGYLLKKCREVIGVHHGNLIAPVYQVKRLSQALC